MGKKKIKTVPASQAEEEVAEGGVKIPKPRKRKSGRKVPKGNIYIFSSYNNTIVSVTDREGNVLAQSSSGRLGFKGAKKSTPFAASQVVRHLLQLLSPYDMREADVFIKGVGSGRESAIRAFGASQIEVISIKDITPVPHNGCR